MKSIHAGMHIAAPRNMAFSASLSDFDARYRCTMVWSAVYFCRYQKKPYTASTTMVGLENTNAVLPRLNLLLANDKRKPGDGPAGARNSR